MPGLVDVAMSLKAAGLSPLPIAGHDWVIRTVDERTKKEIEVDGRKKPAYMNGQARFFSWKKCQRAPLEDEEIRYLFEKAPNIAVAFGVASGNAECIDFDEADVYEEWRALLVEHGYDDLVARLVVQQTQTPGHYQVVYRCPDGIEGNKKLAMRPATAAELARDPGQLAYGLIETRGQGGYALVEPSEGYRVVQGDYHALPTLSGDDRATLLAFARHFDAMPPEPPRERPARDTSAQVGGLLPGDEFDRRGDWDDVLGPKGWRRQRTRGRFTAWTRPGKEGNDTSAHTVVGHDGIEFLVVFSTNAYPLEPTPMKYGKFRAYSTLYHGGDSSACQSAAAKELYAKGYGERVKPKEKAGEIPMPSGPAASEPVTAEPKPRKFTRVRWSELKARPPKPMLVEGFLGVGDSAALVGKRKGGKSAVTFDLILRMLAGNEFANRFEVPRPLRVGYFTEEGTGSVHTRIDAANRTFGLPDSIIEESFWYFENIPQLFDPQDEHHILTLVDELVEDNARLDVIILDTFVKSIHGGQENSNSDVSLCLRTLGKARKALGCASILIHHEGKNGGVRGASALDGDVDEMYWVDWDEETGERKLRFGIAKDLTPWEDVGLSLKGVDEGVPGSFCVEWAAGRRPSTARERIVRAMRRNPEDAWTMAQIRQDTGLNTDTVTKTLSRMDEDGEVVRIKPTGAGQITYRLPKKEGV